jgi:hypothetical protein
MGGRRAIGEGVRRNGGKRGGPGGERRGKGSVAWVFGQN